MKLTWKDAVSTLFVAAVVAIYLAFRDGTSLWLISSARGATAAALVLGFAGGCALSASGSVHSGAKPRTVRLVEAIANTFGVIALLAGVTGLITGSTAALAVLVAATIALWVTATIRHASTIAAGPAGRDVHEVIQPDRTARP